MPCPVSFTLDTNMNNEPQNLNIPLERNEHWGLKLLLAGAVAVCFSSIFSPDFAIVFAASCTVGLPVVWFFFFPPHLAATLLQRGRFGLGYIGVRIALRILCSVKKNSYPLCGWRNGTCLSVKTDHSQGLVIHVLRLTRQPRGIVFFPQNS